MIMQDATLLFYRYRECVLEVWNQYLANPNQEDRFDVHDRWADACVPLFRAMVLYPLDHDDPEIYPDYRGEKKALQYIRIEPIKECEIFINENINSGLWTWNQPTTIGPNQAELRFIKYFDWAYLQKRSFEYVNVLIVKSSKYPDAKDKQALIKTDDIKFLFSRQR